MVGGLVEGISQFAIPFFGPGLKIASYLGKISKVSAALTKAETAAGVGRKGAAIVKGRELGKYAVAGAVTDFAVFDAHEARLSNLIQMAPSLQNPITAFLAADEDDAEIVGRLKNAVEGLGIGGVFDTFLQGLRGFRSGLKAKSAGKSGQEVTDAIQDGMVDLKGYSVKAKEDEYVESISTALNVGKEQATGINALVRSMGLSADDVSFRAGTEEAGGAKGFVEFKEDGSAIITGFKSADVSTGIHEVAHVGRRRLLDRQIPADARRGIEDADISKVEKWAGVGKMGNGQRVRRKSMLAHSSDTLEAEKLPTRVFKGSSVLLDLGCGMYTKKSLDLKLTSKLVMTSERLWTAWYREAISLLVLTN
jgi:hypothetical protein